MGTSTTGNSFVLNALSAAVQQGGDHAERERQRRLTKLAGQRWIAAWAKLERLVASSAYDEAVVLAVDLRDLAGQSRKRMGDAS